MYYNFAFMLKKTLFVLWVEFFYLFIKSVSFTPIFDDICSFTFFPLLSAYLWTSIYYHISHILSFFIIHCFLYVKNDIINQFLFFFLTNAILILIRFDILNSTFLIDNYENLFSTHSTHIQQKYWVKVFLFVRLCKTFYSVSNQN